MAEDVITSTFVRPSESPRKKEKKRRKKKTAGETDKQAVNEPSSLISTNKTHIGSIVIVLMEATPDPGISRKTQEDATDDILHSHTGWTDQRLGGEQDQLPCGLTRISSGKSQETETRMVRACRTTADPKLSQSGTLEGGRQRGQQKEMLDGQRERVGIHVHARTAYNDLMQKRLEGISA